MAERFPATGESVAIIEDLKQQAKLNQKYNELAERLESLAERWAIQSINSLGKLYWWHQAMDARWQTQAKWWQNGVHYHQY